MDGTDLLWNLHKDNLDEARSYEPHRSSGQVAIFVFAGVFAFTGATSPSERMWLWNGIGVAAIAFIGVVLNVVYGARRRRHLAQAAAFREALGARLPDIRIEEIVGAVSGGRSAIAAVPLHVLWIVIDVLLIGAGVALMLRG